MPDTFHHRPTLAGYLLAIAATAIWSGNFIVARGLNDSIPPISLAFWRWVVAVIVFLPLAAKPLIDERHILKQHLSYLCITAVLGITLFNTLIYFAGHTTTALNLSIISITFPLFIIILSRIFFREMMTINRAVGILLVVTGIVMLITRGRPAKLLELSFAVGDIWMLLAAIIFAVYSLLLKRKPRDLSIWAFQLSTFILGLLFLLPFFVWETVSVPQVNFDARTVLAILYVGIGASLAAFLLWNKAVLAIGPSRAGMVYYTLPLFSGLSAHLFLNEAISRIHLYSAMLIVTGIVAANYGNPQIKPRR